MRWGYVLGPLTLVPLLGALFFIPRPNGDDSLRFDRASLSLLTCHGPAGGIVALPGDDSAASSLAGAGGLRVRVER